MSKWLLLFRFDHHHHHYHHNQPKQCFGDTQMKADRFLLKFTREEEENLFFLSWGDSYVYEVSNRFKHRYYNKSTTSLYPLAVGK